MVPDTVPKKRDHVILKILSQKTDETERNKMCARKNSLEIAIDCRPYRSLRVENMYAKTLKPQLTLVGCPVLIDHVHFRNRLVPGHALLATGGG